MPSSPFCFETPPGPLLHRAATAAARPLLSWALKAGTLQTLYEQIDHARPEDFAARALALLNIDVACDELRRVPEHGALIVAANHPHGALDGLVLAALLSRRRRDVRLLANHLLSRIPELHDSCFFVDPFGGPMAAMRSRPGLRAAHLWLRDGGALVVFPAGEVAHRRRSDGLPVDSGWSPLVGRMALHTGAEVIPAFIDGSNSGVFYAAGRLHPACRTALLVRELLKKRGQRASVRFGRGLSRRELVAGGFDGAGATIRIRAAVESLRGAGRVPSSRTVAADATAAEVAGLPSESRLVESGALSVFCSPAAAIPSVLREVGRLREITYSAIGEGTGRPVDLDRFDEHYLHLFSWDRERRHVVGAYRIGRIDDIVAARGVDGLYTRTLFRYGRAFVERLPPALELGRSFVRAEYQRHPGALLLLWKGIGRFVARHPRYRVLIGPVSISARYCEASRAVLMAFLEQNHGDRSLTELVTALNPPVLPPPHADLPRTVDGADGLISSLEPDGKGMPVLLRHYLRLNARAIGFNVDPQFSNALDALMLVDLAAVDPIVLARYLGRGESERFLEQHRRQAASRAA